MQRSTSAITFPHTASHPYLHSMQKPDHTSIQSLTPRFCVHETLQIKQSNFPTESGLEVAPVGALGGLISNNVFVQGLKRIITFMPVDRNERYFHNRIFLIKANPE